MPEKLKLNLTEWEMILDAVDFMAGGSDDSADLYERLVSVDFQNGVVITDA